MGRLAHELPPLTCPQCRGRRATKRAAGERLARRSSRYGHLDAPGLQRPGSGLGGCPGWRSGRRGTERSAAQRPASLSVRQAGLVHAQREGNRARDPRARERAAACLSRQRRPDRVASGMEARQGRDAGTPVARRAARQPGPALRGDAHVHRDLAHQGRHTDDTDPESTRPDSAQPTQQVLHHAPENRPRHQHPTAMRGCHSEPRLA